MRRTIHSVLLAFTIGCGEEETLRRAGEEEYRETFVQEAEPKLDVLWVIDNSVSMRAEQDKVAAEASAFFQRLLGEAVDYHVGVITSDPNEGGVLRRSGRSVEGCDRCRFIGRSVPCSDPNDASTCPALDVFREMVLVGTEGSVLERPFEQVANAVGLTVLDRESQTPMLDPETGRPLLRAPDENQGFLRDDANLMVLFVSDEDEGLKQVGPPVRYYERLLTLLKRGTEARVLVGAIMGWPIEGQFDSQLPLIEEACSFIRPAWEGGSEEGAVRAALQDPGGCVDVRSPNAEDAFAEVGRRYAELSCRMGGVVTNICNPDYRDALQVLSNSAVRLGKEFVLRFASELDRGEDCRMFTGDEEALDCDEDGSVDGELDGPICVLASSGGEPGLVPRSESNGWTFDDDAAIVRFPGDFEPAPGSGVEVRYKLFRGVRRCP